MKAKLQNLGFYGVYVEIEHETGTISFKLYEEIEPKKAMRKMAEDYRKKAERLNRKAALLEQAEQLI